MNGDLQKAIIIGKMAMDEIDLSTLCFFKDVYSLFTNGAEVTSKQMGEFCFLSRPRVNAHILALTKAGYLERRSRHTWRLANNVISCHEIACVGLADMILQRV